MSANIVRSAHGQAYGLKSRTNRGKPAFIIATMSLFVLLAIPSVSAAPLSASSPTGVVTTLVSPFTAGSTAARNKVCNGVTGAVEGCPITTRLRTWLQHPVPMQENGNLISRSQNPPMSVQVAQIDNNGQVAHVNTTWQYGPNTYTITFVVNRAQGTWFIDDSYCAAQPGTSIYNVPVGPCSPDSSSTAIVNVAALRLRAAPSTAGVILGIYPRGTIVTVLDRTSGGWAHIKVPGGRVGWMLEQYLRTR